MKINGRNQFSTQDAINLCNMKKQELQKAKRKENIKNSNLDSGSNFKADEIED